MVIIGLMSGTSADGIDAAAVDFHGQGRRTRISVLHFVSIPYSQRMRDAILDACSPKYSWPWDLCPLNHALGELFGEAACTVAAEAGIPLSEVTAIASHGQTVWHQPEPREIGDRVGRGTFQIGSPAVIAASTGCRVISDFRSADMAAGGQGAPLVPYFDWVLLGSKTEARAILNIGGIANVTHLPRSGKLKDVRAFDTGPGNMVIDHIAGRLTGGKLAMDAGGELAARGEVKQKRLNRLLDDPFFALAPPKSTGREKFGHVYADGLWEAEVGKGMKPVNLLATVTALTAESINRAFQNWVGAVDTVIAGGGGVKNKTLVSMLNFGGARITGHDEFGIPDDAKEAVAFALLAYETLHGRPSNVPSATGASRSVVLGSITPAP